MARSTAFRIAAAGMAVLMLASCAGSDSPVTINQNLSRVDDDGNQRDTIWDLFDNNDDPNVTVEVNKYIWAAALDVHSFLPVESADPFTGVIVMGYGTPPGGGRAYRATVFVKDPALDARSLTLALQSRSGTVSAATVRAVEDAILTRARQLRVQDSRL